jgi:hypothetical protein
MQGMKVLNFSRRQSAISKIHSSTNEISVVDINKKFSLKNPQDNFIC